MHTKLDSDMIDPRRAWRYLMWLLEVTPYRVAMAIAFTLAWLFSRLMRSTRGSVLNRMRLAGIPHPEQTSNRLVGNLARFAVMFARQPKLQQSDLTKWVRVEGKEIYQAAKKRNRGVIIATGHLGNWEMGAFALSAAMEPVVFVGWVEARADLHRYITERRAAFGSQVLANRNTARTIVRLLRENKTVVCAFDAETFWVRSTRVDFLGRPAHVSSAVARVAAISRAVVLPATCLWSDAEKKYVARIHPPLTLSGDEQQDTQALYSGLEKLIRGHPDQWLWTRNPGWIS